MITENLTTLKIHKLTRDQYNRELESGNIDENALYLTPDETTDLSMYATKQDLNDKADKDHTHNNYATTDYVDGNFALKSEIGNIELSGYAKKSDLEIHNTNIEAHNDIRDLISGLSTKVTNFLDVDEDTTDQLSEVLTLINNNKGTLESLTTTKVNVSDIINNLTTNVSNKPLSAAQGVEIKRLIDILQDELDSLESVIDRKADENHGHSNATTTTDGFMSADDKILLDKYRTDNLGSFGGKTIPELKTAIENWISIVYNAPNASVCFSGDIGKIVEYWNSEDTTSTIPDGATITINLSALSIYGDTSKYTLLKLTSYYDKVVYYVALSNGVWSQIRRVIFADDAVSKASSILTTHTNPSSASTYYIPFHSNTTTDYKSLLTNNGLQYYTREGTTSGGGTAQLGVGNSVATGTVGNKSGLIYLYGTGSGYTNIIPTHNGDGAITINLPSSSGTLALKTDTVTGASKLYRQSTLSTVEELDNFNEHGYMKYACISREASPYSNDGTILSIPFNYGNNGTQLWFDDGSGEGGMAIRSSKGMVDGAIAWNPWRKVLTEKNYSEYALPITGGTVNGHIYTQHPTGGETNIGVQHTGGKLYLYGNNSDGTRGIWDTTRGGVISVTNTSATFIGNLSGNADSATYSGHIIRNDGNTTATLAYSNANKSSLGWGIKMTDSNSKPSYMYLTANAENEAPWMRLYGADGSTYTDVLTKANYYNWALPLACNSDTSLTGILYFSTNNWAGDIVGRNASNQKRWELFSNSNTGAVADCILHVHKNTEGTTYAQYKFGTDGTLTATKFKGSLDGNATTATTATTLYPYELNGNGSSTSGLWNPFTWIINTAWGGTTGIYGIQDSENVFNGIFSVKFRTGSNAYTHGNGTVKWLCASSSSLPEIKLTYVLDSTNSKTTYRLYISVAGAYRTYRISKITEIGTAGTFNAAQVSSITGTEASKSSTTYANEAGGVQDYNDTSRVIQIGYQGGGATTSNLAYIAGYLIGGTKIKDVSKDVLQSWLGLGSAAYTASTNYATSGHSHTYLPTYDIKEAYLSDGFWNSFRTSVKGSSSNGTFISVLRSNSDLSGYTRAYGTGLSWGKDDTHGYLYLDYSSDYAVIGAGSSNKINWLKRLSFSDHTHSYLPLSGGTMTGSIITPKDDNMGIIPHTDSWGQIGSADKKFYRMYAKTFYGNLSGNADTATTATTAITATNAEKCNGVISEWGGSVAWDDTGWIAAWNSDGSKIKALNKNNFATASHVHSSVTASASNTVPTTSSTGLVQFHNNILYTSTGMFSATNNANAIITLNKHSGNYDSQLGFSNNGNIYYRSFNGSALDTTTAWRQLAFTDSTLSLSGGTMNSGARISHGGSLYLGNADNSGWVHTQDIASQSGHSLWAINVAGSAWFKDVHIGGYTYSTKGSYALNTSSFYCQSWLRSGGDTGWYNETHGGGWYMTDSTWIRNYNSKPVLINYAGQGGLTLDNGTVDTATGVRVRRTDLGYEARIGMSAAGNIGIWCTNHGGRVSGMIYKKPTDATDTVYIPDRVVMSGAYGKSAPPETGTLVKGMIYFQIVS